MNEESKASNQKKIGGTNFLITIHHQDGLNWQGIIQWVDTGKKIHFRSTQEMLSLMDEALFSKSKLEDSKRSWKDVKSIRAI